jgi:hypothetical protein
MALHYKKITPTHKKKIATLVVVGALFGGGINANAALLDGVISAVSQFVGGSFSADNTEALTDRIMVASSQTAITPSQISVMMETSAKALFVAMSAEKQAYAIKDVVDGMKFSQPEYIDPETGEKVAPIVGAGLSSDLNCEALANKTVIQSKELISDTETYNAHRRLAQLYSTDPTVKQTNRVTRHIQSYCDVTEVSKGACSLVIGNMASADTNYANLYSNDALSNSDVDAAIAYVLNVVDPASTKIEGCETNMCNSVTAVNTSYQALSNVAQGAFLNQMTDRMYYEYQGSKAGKELGKSTNVVVGGGTGTSTPATDPTTPTKPADQTKPDSTTPAGSATPATTPSTTKTTEATKP